MMLDADFRPDAKINIAEGRVVIDLPIEVVQDPTRRNQIVDAMWDSAKWALWKGDVNRAETLVTDVQRIIVTAKALDEAEPF